MSHNPTAAEIMGERLRAALRREDHLQQRLTAADERVDVLEGLLREIRQSCELSRLRDAQIDAALKPGEPATDEHACTGCGSKGWTANCKECVPY